MRAPLRSIAVLALLSACGGSTATPDAAGHAADAAHAPDAAPDALLSTAGTSCATAIDLTSQTTPLAADTTGRKNLTGATCAAGAAMAPEMYFVVDAGTTPVDLIATVSVDETVMAPFDVVLSARTTCDDPGSETLCVDQGWGEVAELLDATGNVFFLVDGTADASGLANGAFHVAVARREIRHLGDDCDPAGVASRCDVDLICTSGKCATNSPTNACLDAPDVSAALATGPFTDTQTIHAFDADYFQGSCRLAESGNHPERLYRFHVASPATIDASTDDVATTYDTVLYLRQGDCTTTTADTLCNDDVLADTNFRSHLTGTLSAGDYTLFVDESSGFLYGPPTTPRTYRLTLAVDTLPITIDAGPDLDAAPDLDAGIPDAHPPDATPPG